MIGFADNRRQPKKLALVSLTLAVALPTGCVDTKNSFSSSAVVGGGQSKSTEQEIDSKALNNCTKPVYLMVHIEQLDRTKSAAYGKALRKSGIVSRYGGEYLMVSPPSLMLEGDWPADNGFMIERYPCRAMFEAMWFSDEYQNELKPLRDGSGVYTVALFDSWPPSISATGKQKGGQD